MEEARLALLQSEIKAQLKIIEEIYTKIDERKENVNDDPRKLESLAYQLHNLYCAFEDLFKIVASFGPALIDQEAYKLLDSLRTFRHWFRHAYSYEIEPRKVKIVLEDALKLKGLFKRQASGFIQEIKQS